MWPLCHNQQNQSKTRRELANFHVYVHLASESFTSTLLGKMRTGPKNSNFPFFKTIFVFIQRLPIIFDFFHFCLDSDYRQFCFTFKKTLLFFSISLFINSKNLLKSIAKALHSSSNLLNVQKHIECSSLFHVTFCPLVFLQGLLIWVILITCWERFSKTIFRVLLRYFVLSSSFFFRVHRSTFILSYVN